jgi:small nuclear ribonucleoprotein (snRNP)-like protein
MVLGAQKRVRVHTKDGKTVEGLLARKKPEFVLELADLIEADEHGDIRTTELEGKVRILRDNVSLYQEVSSTAARL